MIFSSCALLAAFLDDFCNNGDYCYFSGRRSGCEKRDNDDWNERKEKYIDNVQAGDAPTSESSAPRPVGISKRERFRTRGDHSRRRCRCLYRRAWALSPPRACRMLAERRKAAGMFTAHNRFFSRTRAKYCTRSALTLMPHRSCCCCCCERGDRWKISTHGAMVSLLRVGAHQMDELRRRRWQNVVASLLHNSSNFNAHYEVCLVFPFSPSFDSDATNIWTK